jgi:hypothetical protein
VALSGTITLMFHMIHSVHPHFADRQSPELSGASSEFGIGSAIPTTRTLVDRFRTKFTGAQNREMRKRSPAPLDQLWPPSPDGVKGERDLVFSQSLSIGSNGVKKRTRRPGRPTSFRLEANI